MAAQSSFADPDGVFCNGFEECPAPAVSQSFDFRTEIHPLAEFDMALRQDGTPAIAYSSDGLRFYDCSDAVCSTGTDRELMTSGSGLEIAIGSTGNPVISYYDSGMVHLYVCTAPDCSSGVDRSLAPSAGVRTSVALKLDGSPVISFKGDSASLDLHLGIYNCDDPSCASGSVQAPLVCPTGLNLSHLFDPTQIAIGADGNPIIAMSCYEGECFDFPECSVYTLAYYTSIYRCTMTDCSAGSGGPGIGGASGPGLVLKDMVVRPDSDVVLLHEGEPIVGPLVVTYCSSPDVNGICSARTDLTIENASDGRLVLSPSLRPLIAHSPDLSFYRCGDEMCNDGFDTILSRAGMSSSALTLDVSGAPLMIYEQSSTGPASIFSCRGELCSER